ncbi:GNAT family N-acetyltransferase [Demequina sp. NBRC 110054]|uniref:GNAT family N-acetyltransferase n=1 Tax=Demequina sp. NBRC 110054 TaxID=1570343 RepID=UPI000A010A0D|nr:GNAT family N-acetyltransferase [Demequina sp. NBRC 110054]
MDSSTELDHPAVHALAGPHHDLGTARGRVARYRASVAPFAALPADASAADWEDLGSLAGDEAVALFGVPFDVPDNWETLEEIDAVQMVAPRRFGLEPTDATRDSVARLSLDDSDAMLDLAEQTHPGPFATETALMGAYYGVWEEGELVAMAGERLTTPSWAEISAVCTRESHRGRGLATRLMAAVAAGSWAQDRTPFLHVVATNVTAIQLYVHLGFTVRTGENRVQVVRRREDGRG